MNFYCIKCSGYVQGHFPTYIACKPKDVGECNDCGKKGIGIQMQEEERNGTRQRVREAEQVYQETKEG